MIAAAIREGCRAGWRNRAAWVLLWIFSLMLALPVGLNAFEWWSSALSRRPDADALLDGFQLGVWIELAQYDRSTTWERVLTPAFLSLLIALLLSPMLAGGVLETLISRKGPGSFLHRFFRGAGRYYGPYFRLLLLFLATLALVSGIWFGITNRGIDKLSDSEWEPAPVVLGLIQLAVFLVAAIGLFLAMDMARIQMAVEERRSAFRAWRSSLRLVLKHPLPIFGTWVAGAVALAILAAAFAALLAPLGARSWIAIGAAAAMHQAFVIGRFGLRVAQVGSQVEIFRALSPPPCEPRPEQVEPPSEVKKEAPDAGEIADALNDIVPPAASRPDAN